MDTRFVGGDKAAAGVGVNMDESGMHTCEGVT